MARYIDVDIAVREAIDACNKLFRKKGEFLTSLDAVEIAEALDDIPAADVVEVKRGEWRLKSEIHRFFEEVDEYFYIECPFCKREFYVPFEFDPDKMLEYARKNYPYCNCGAKMDGGKKE